MPLSELNFVRAWEIGINREVPIVEAIACGTANNDQTETDLNDRLHNDNLIQHQNKSEYRRMICVSS
jgi:hypothetical protein